LTDKEKKEYNNKRFIINLPIMQTPFPFLNEPISKELSEQIDRALKSQEELRKDFESGRLTVKQWAKNLVSNMDMKPYPDNVQVYINKNKETK
jgi:hypothetical protein